MGGLGSIRVVLAAGCALAAGAVGVSIAAAQEGPPVPVSFEDPAARVGAANPALDLSVRDANPRFAPIATASADGDA